MKSSGTVIVGFVVFGVGFFLLFYGSAGLGILLLLIGGTMFSVPLAMDEFRKTSQPPFVPDINMTLKHYGEESVQEVAISIGATLADLRKFSRTELLAFLAGTNDLSQFDGETRTNIIALRERVNVALGSAKGGDPFAIAAVEVFVVDDATPRERVYVYLMKMYGVTKVGVTSDIDRRMAEHRRNGWKQVRVWKVQNMAEARRIERRCLTTASGLGALLSDTELQALMPQGGYTEVTRMSVDHLERIINDATM